jgi:hypothetical protein
MKPEQAAALLGGSLVAYAPAALPYVGPGAGLGMIASLVAVVLAVLATIVGLVIWPIRRLMRRKKAGADDSKPPVDPGAE